MNAIKFETARIHFLSDGFIRCPRRCLSSLLGTLQNYDSDGNGNVNKAIGLLSKTTALHVHHAFWGQM